MKLKLLSIVVGAVLAVGAAQAKEPVKADTATQQATRAEIDRLVERIETLSRQLGDGADIKVMVRRGDRHAPRALGDGGKREVLIEKIQGGDFRSGPGLGIVMASNPAASGVRIMAPPAAPVPPPAD